jgi:O-antigen/teichoic acid export membrane protein
VKKVIDTKYHFMNRLFGFSLGPVIGSFLGIVSVFIITPLIIPSELGKSSMFLMAENLLPLVLFLGLDRSFVREYHTVDDEKKILFHTMPVPFILSLFFSFVIILFHRTISLWLFNEIDFIAVFVLALCLPLRILTRFALLVIRMREKAKLYSLINIIQKALYIVFLVLFILLYSRSFKSIIFASTLSLLVVVIIQIFLTSNLWFSISRFDKSFFMKLLGYAAPLIPTAFLIWAFNSIDKISLRIFSDYNELGIYSAAFRIIAVLTIIKTIFSTFWSPTAYRWHKQGFGHDKFLKVTRLMLFGMSLLYCIGIISRRLLYYIFDPVYFPSINLLPFLFFMPIMYTISETTVLGIYFSRKTIYSLIISIVSLVSNTVGNIILVPLYGALGAAISTGVSYIIFFWGRTLFSVRLGFRVNIKLIIITQILLLLPAFLSLVSKNIIIISVEILVFLILIIIFRKDIVIIIELFKEILAEFKKRIRKKKKSRIPQP